MRVNTHILSLILAVILWGSSLIGTKTALQFFGPLSLCLARFVVSSVLLVLLRLKKGFVKPSNKDLKYILLSSMIGITLYYALENYGVSLTTASAASLITAAYPIITILIGLIFFKERTSKRMALGIVLGVLGVMMLGFSGSGETQEMMWAGNSILIINGILWALYNYITQKISDDCDSFTVTYIQILFGTICFVPFALIENSFPAVLTLPAVFSLLFLSAGCTVGALLLYNIGLRNVSASLAASLLNLMPVSGVILSVILLHESLSLIQIIGGIIILLGVMISTSRPE